MDALIATIRDKLPPEAAFELICELQIFPDESSFSVTICRKVANFARLSKSASDR